MLKNKLLKTDIFYINSKTTGGHYAFKTLKSVKPFENNMRECKSIKLQDSDIVVDIGAYVGEYSMYASRQGVKKVYSYEPTPRTFKLLKKNKTSKNLGLLALSICYVLSPLAKKAITSSYKGL